MDDNLSEKGLVPGSSDSTSSGALPIEGTVAPSRSAGRRSLRPLNALPPAAEPVFSSFDEEECKEIMEAPGAKEGTQDNIYINAECAPAVLDVRAYAVQGQEDVQEHVYGPVFQQPPAAAEPKKWHERRFMRVLLAILLAILLVVIVVALVMCLPKPAQVTPTPTSAPAPLPPEQVACNFLSIPDLMECRTTVKFDTLAGDYTTGSTIPSEIALLSRLTYLDVSYSSLTGTIPSEIGLLTRLTDLYFSDNELSGTMPSSLCSLTSLGLIYIDCGEIACASGCCASGDTYGVCG